MVVLNILLNIWKFYIRYKNSKSNNNSLIYLAINEFVIAFKDMIMKLKNVGIKKKNIK